MNNRCQDLYIRVNNHVQTLRIHLEDKKIRQSKAHIFQEDRFEEIRLAVGC